MTHGRMNRQRRLTKTVVLLFVASLVLVPYTPSFAEVNHTTIPDKIIVSQEGAYRGYFPDVVKAANGDLIVVYYWATSHSRSDGKIMMKRSTDNGATWGEAVTVVDTPYDDRDPSIALLSDGTLLISWFVSRVSDAVPIETRVMRSTDHGYTWTDMVTVQTNLAWAATSAKIIELSNGDLLIPIYGPGGAAVIRSTDKGFTWSASTESIIMPGTSEPAIAELENGHIKALLRGRIGNVRTGYEAHSYDYGATWGSVKELGVPIIAPELFRIPGTNKIFQAWSDFGGGRPVKVRMGYTDRPWEFGRSAVLYSNKTSGDMGYSGTVMLNSTDLFTVFYDAQRGIIGGTYSKISDWEVEYVTKIDLKSLYQSGGITVSTDMTWTDPRYPAAGVAAAFDGSTSYYNSAFKEGAAPAYFTIDLKQSYKIGSMGISLKPGYKQSANVYFSMDGVNWGSPVQTYHNVDTAEIDYKHFGSGTSARYIKIEITSSQGWAGLNEIELYKYRVYGEHRLDLNSMYANNEISVTTDMTWTDPRYPAAGVAAVFDGSTSYYNSAFKNGAAPAYFTIDLKSEYSIGSIGICLKPGYKETAYVYLSTDGVNWGSSVLSLGNANTASVFYVHLPVHQNARYVKVEIASSEGWAGLNEIEIYTD